MRLAFPKVYGYVNCYSSPGGSFPLHPHARGCLGAGSLSEAVAVVACTSAGAARPNFKTGGSRRVGSYAGATLESLVQRLNQRAGSSLRSHFQRASSYLRGIQLGYTEGTLQGGVALAPCRFLEGPRRCYSLGRHCGPYYNGHRPNPFRWRGRFYCYVR